MITAKNLTEERLLSLLDTATPTGMLLWFDMAIENARNNGASNHDLATFISYRDNPDPEARREFLKAFFKRGFREGWVAQFFGLAEGPLIA